MNDRPIERGDRVQIGRTYGKVALVCSRVLWFHDDDGRYRCAPIVSAQRVHGLKHRKER